MPTGLLDIEGRRSVHCPASSVHPTNYLSTVEGDKLRRVVYIAGKISDPDCILLAQHLQRFTQTEHDLLCAGYAPINPGADWSAVSLGGVVYEDLMARDRALLMKSDVVYFMIGWRDSLGALREHRWAKRCGIPCVEEMEGDVEHGFRRLSSVVPHILVHT